MWALSPTVYATEFVGHMQKPHVDLFLGFSQERVSANPGRLYVFHDWIDMTGYDTICRQMLTKWTANNLRAYAAVHVAVQSKLVAMGVQVANLALGGLVTAYTGRAQLETALRACLAKLG